MKKILFTLFITSFYFITLNAQSVTGIVKVQKSDGSLEPLPFASVYWLEGRLSIEADDNGEFSFSKGENTRISLIASGLGYTRDTLVLGDDQYRAELIIRESNTLGEVRVTGRQRGNFLSKTTPVKTEVISAAGLCKMACCNLAESFENSASISVGFSDAITGARQIRLLGLSGQYTQMLDETRPVMRGIASPFGLSYIPGQWLESIQIAKGPSSVVNGLEAITGQINMEHRKPTAEQPLFLNLFVSNVLRTEMNIASSLQLNQKWSTVALGHFSTDPMSHDGNSDGFRDEPLTTQFNLSNRWLYLSDKGLQIRFGFKALSDSRVAGMHDFKKGDPVSVDMWGSEIGNRAINGYFKVGVPLNEDNSQNIAAVVDYNFHQLNSFFGLKKYDATQNSAFINLMYQNQVDEHNRYVIGLSSQYDLIDETFIQRGFLPSGEIQTLNTLTPGREESALGLYGEYNYTLDDKITVVTGLRLDYNNLHGWLFSPRANLKYSFTEQLVLRASAGRGFRSPNQISDNLGSMSTGRALVLEENPLIEDAWTYGANFTGYVPVGFNDNAYISLEYFRTDFKNQLIADQERDLSAVWFYNVAGKAYTNTYQVDVSVEPFERFTVLATYRYSDPKVTLHGRGLTDRALISKYKGVLNLQYATRMNIWTFDFTAQLNGPARLPYFMEMEYSPVYTMLFAQITRKFRDLDIYVGGENLTNYRQKDAILSAQNPYGEDFNSSVIWGPLMGIKLYAGLRFTLWK
ncbi:MAG: TonB-dependent receptor [Bacteroidales bacterium]|nr:TonB-dependent receptor [Bacteroidales bacterium]MDD2425042.1 TonB-dependent receptor [Bacteroidales bacterium]MDD3988649.1 TonB-dependent receptor [Bacteroidales bacterium]MDD4638331.1 TonB-dependent receptor [Bacteroidales bacterium]